MTEVTTIDSWDELISLDDADYTNVPIGGGKSVRLGSLSAARMIQWFEDQKDEEKSKINGLVLVAECLVDSNGKRIGKLADVLKLRDKNPETLKKLRLAAIELNNLEVKGVERPNDSSDSPAVPTSTGDSPTD